MANESSLERERNFWHNMQAFSHLGQNSDLLQNEAYKGVVRLDCDIFFCEG